MREYAFFTNFPTPHKVDLFNYLNGELEGRITFFFYASSVPKRKGWERDLERANFRYEVLDSLRIKTSVGFGSDEAYAFLPRHLPDLSRFRKVVISGGLTPVELFLSLKTLSHGVPYILWTGAPSLSFGGWWGVPYRALVRFLLFSNAYAVVAATGTAAEHARRLGARRVEVAYTTFDVERFRYDKVHRGECLSAVFVGRLIKVKRVPDLLEAVSTVSSVTLDVVGEGPLREDLERMAGEMGITDRVRFLGKADYGKMPLMYRRYDLLLLPSEWEVFGFVVVEALMSSLAVAVSEGVGAKDFLPEWAIFPVGDVGSIARIVERMKDPSVRNDVVRFGRGKVESLATPERWARTFASLLEE